MPSHRPRGGRASSASLRRANITRNAVLGALAVALLAIAGWRLFWRTDPDELAPNDAASAAHFVCDNCGEFFALSPREIEQAERTGRAGGGGRTNPGSAAPSSSDADPTGGRAISFTCPKCGERRGVRAEKCPAHGDIIKLFPGSHDAVKCSKCDFRG